MLQADITQEHVQGFRSVHKSQPPSTTSVPLHSPEVVHIDCYTDPDTNKDYILWDDIQQAFNEALSVRNRTKMLPFAKGKDLRAVEPHRIAAVADVVLDVVVGGEWTAAEVASMGTLQDLFLITPPQSSSSSARRSPAYGDTLEALQNYNHMDVPASVSHLRGPHTVHAERKDDSNSIPTEQGLQPKIATSNLLDPQDYDATANMSLMQTMVRANQGDVQAQVALGDRYKDGQEVHQDHQAALDWYLKAAEQDHPRAQYNIGLLYEEEDGEEEEEEEEDEKEDDDKDEDDEERDDDEGDDVVLEDDTKAFGWFLKSAIQGYVDAQAKVSKAYANGAGVSKNNFKATAWLVKAAENGHAESQYNMGAAYEKGQGVPQSNHRSFVWYLKSAIQGFAKAQERVAAALEAGRGVSKDRAKAAEWYTKAADQGLPAAQFALARIYQLGLRGRPKDWSETVGWFIKAAVQGHTEAQAMLRGIYECGNLISLDLQAQSKIKEWFMIAAKEGDRHAQCCMASMYEVGRLVDLDESKAFEWYLKAAENGDETAQKHVAYGYKTGLGVTESREKSIEWLLRLTTKDFRWAVQHLKDLIGK